MRTFKTLLLAAVIAISFTLSAYATETTETTETTKETTEEPTTITKEIRKLLNEPNFKIDQDINALVKIVINKDNQMVVLSVDSNNKMVESYIKSRLNYKTLDNNITEKDKAYIVPVRITQE